MATKRVFNLNLDGAFLPFHLPVLSLTYMGSPIDLPLAGVRALVNGKVRNVAGYNHRLYAELASNEIPLTQDEMAFQVIEDGILVRQNDQIRILWLPSAAREDFRVQSGNILTHLNVGQWHPLRSSNTKRTLLLPNGRTSVYFRFEQKWSIQMDVFLPLQA